MAISAIPPITPPTIPPIAPLDSLDDEEGAAVFVGLPDPSFGFVEGAEPAVPLLVAAVDTVRRVVPDLAAEFVALGMALVSTPTCASYLCELLVHCASSLPSRRRKNYGSRRL